MCFGAGYLNVGLRTTNFSILALDNMYSIHVLIHSFIHSFPPFLASVKDVFLTVLGTGSAAHHAHLKMEQVEFKSRCTRNETRARNFPKHLTQPRDAPSSNRKHPRSILRTIDSGKPNKAPSGPEEEGTDSLHFQSKHRTHLGEDAPSRAA
jgi:hypothetical protein